MLDDPAGDKAFEAVVHMKQAQATQERPVPTPNELRKQIARNQDDDINGGNRAYAKPSIGPGERPLQRHPR